MYKKIILLLCALMLSSCAFMVVKETAKVIDIITEEEPNLTKAQELRTPKYRKRVVEDKRRKEINMNNDINNWEDDGIDSIDNKIDEVNIAELDGIESELDHIDMLDDKSFSELQDAIKELLDDCSKSNIKKVGKFLVKLTRKEK